MSDPTGWKRRQFLKGLAVLTVPGLAIAADDDRELEAVKNLASKAGIEGMKDSKNDQYLAVGDAPAKFRDRALDLCTALSRDYLKHFSAKGFPAEKPKDRLTLVVLSGPEAFAAFMGEKVDQVVGGIYDLETNRLVMFDNRKNDQVGKPELANTIALMHEATHQLTFNTGLLDRQGDVPLFLSEGLAMYGETRRPSGKEKVGELNLEWLPTLHPKGGPISESHPAPAIAGRR